MEKPPKENHSLKHSRTNRAGASATHHDFSHRVNAWYINHVDVAKQSISRLLSTPISSLTTVLVLAIALALPTGLNVAIKNIERLTGQVNQTVQLSLYLHDQVDSAAGLVLANRIVDWPGVDEAVYISPEQALSSFKSSSSYGEIINHLPSNPLPGVIAITLNEQSLSVNDANHIKSKANSLAEVTQTKIDVAWLEKVKAIIGLIRRTAAGLTVLLAIGVVLVVGNTIKLAIDNRKEEIIVTKLVGATNAFVRRPFLYMGVWFGAGSAVIALLLVSVSIVALAQPISSLSDAYSIPLEIVGFGLGNSIALLFCGIALGWLGAWLASSQHIQAIDPN